MRTKAITAVLITTLVAPAIFGGNPAVGSVSPPSTKALERPEAPAKALFKAPSVKHIEKKSEKKSLLRKFREKWARFRPVNKKRSEDREWAQADRILHSKTTIEEIFDKDMSRRLHERYEGSVRPFEQEALSPYHRASNWKMQRYEESRKALAEWTMKEVGRDQLKDFVRRRRDHSEVLSTVATGAGNPAEEESRQITEEERIARAHRIDRPVLANEEEEVIPTKLRARLNLLKAQGQFTFVNPVVTTSVEAKAGAGENLAVVLNRDFKELEMNSRLRYGVDQSLVVLNVNKRITNEVSVDLLSERWTGSQRGSVGEKSKDTAKVLYSVSF